MLVINSKNSTPVILVSDVQQRKLTWGAPGRFATLFFSNENVKCFTSVGDVSEMKVWATESRAKNWPIALKILLCLVTGIIVLPIILGIILGVYRTNKFTLMQNNPQMTPPISRTQNSFATLSLIGPHVQKLEATHSASQPTSAQHSLRGTQHDLDRSLNRLETARSGSQVAAALPPLSTATQVKQHDLDGSFESLAEQFRLNTRANEAKNISYQVSVNALRLMQKALAKADKIQAEKDIVNILKSLEDLPIFAEHYHAFLTILFTQYPKMQEDFFCSRKVSFNLRGIQQIIECFHEDGQVNKNDITVCAGIDYFIDRLQEKMKQETTGHFFIVPNHTGNYWHAMDHVFLMYLKRSASGEYHLLSIDGKGLYKNDSVDPIRNLPQLVEMLSNQSINIPIYGYRYWRQYDETNCFIYVLLDMLHVYKHPEIMEQAIKLHHAKPVSIPGTPSIKIFDELPTEMMACTQSLERLEPLTNDLSRTIDGQSFKSFIDRHAVFGSKKDGTIVRQNGFVDYESRHFIRIVIERAFNGKAKIDPKML